MSVKLTVLYGEPADRAAFDRHYTEVHLPIVARWPGVERTEVAWVRGAPGGGPAPYHLMAEITFADQQALDAALASDAGQEAARDFMSIAPPGSAMLVCDITDA